MNLDDLKKQAAEAAVSQIKSGMVIGLGTGSTAVHAVRAIGRLLDSGDLENIVGIPTSERTAAEARNCGVPLVTLSDQPRIDIAIDGADEIDPYLNVIKGLGGALLREKIVEITAARLIIVGDYTKRVAQLGELAPVPVEVVPFSVRPVTDYLNSLGANAVLREVDGQPFITDERNVIVDCHFGLIDNPEALAQAIINRPGVVEHGLFLDMATEAIVASPDGLIYLDKPD